MKTKFATNKLKTIDAEDIAKNDVESGERFVALDYKQGQFVLSDEGVIQYIYTEDRQGNSREEEIKICDWIKPVAESHNKDRKGWGILVKYKDRRGVIQETLIKYSLLSGGKLIEKLDDEGFNYYITPPRNGMSAIHHYLRAYPKAGLPEITTTPTVGWVEDDENPFSCFVYRGGCIRSSKGSYGLLDGDGNQFKLSPRGTLEGWQETIAANAYFSKRVIFALCVAFVGPLLKIVDGSGVMYHFYGDSGTGKSSALCAANTVWNATQTLKLETWNTTANNLQTKAIDNNNIIVIKDELGQMDKKIASSIAYAFGNGSERSRNIAGGSSAEQRSYLTPGLSAGELSLSDIRDGEAMATGEQVRFVQIPAIADLEKHATEQYGIFEDYPSVVKEFESITDKSSSHYFDARRAFLDSFNDRTNAGIAGKTYLEKLVRYIEENDINRIKDEAQQFITDFEHSIKGEVTKDQFRVLRGFSHVAFAGHLARQFGILPYAESDILEAVTTCFDAWRYSENTPEAHRRKFIEQVELEPRTSAVFYGGYFKDGITYNSVSERTPPDGKYGSYIVEASSFDNNQSGIEQSVLCQIYDAFQFQKLVERCGHGLRKSEAIAALRERDLLLTNDGALSAYYKVNKGARVHFGMDQNTRYYVLIPSNVEDIKGYKDMILSIFKSARTRCGVLRDPEDQKS